MASIADMLIGGVQKTVQDTSPIAQGAQLAESIQSIQIKRQEVEQKKQELQMQKAIAVTDTLKIAAQSKDKNLKNFLLKKVLPSKVKALGMEEFFTPQTLEMVQSSDEVQQKVLGLQLELDNKVRAGEISGADAYQTARRILSDPEELALLNTDQLFEAQKFQKSEEGKGYRAKQMAEASLGKQMQAQQAVGSTEAARNIGKEYAEYQAVGGRANIDKNLKKLKGALEKLESGEVELGKISAAVPGLKSDVAQDILNPTVSRLRDDIRGAFQSSLKQTLGSQFTAQEGEAIFNRSFNPRLSSKENARRLRTEIESLEQMVKDKEQAFEAGGFKLPGKSSTIKKSSNWETVIDKQKETALKFKGDKLKEYIEKFSKKYDISIDKVKKKLGVK